MKTGEIVINGNVGMHLGEKMAGGKITVNGDAWPMGRRAMKKGLIEIHGNAGDYLASPYRGSTEGMKGGKIVVDGDVGSDSGCLPAWWINQNKRQQHRAILRIPHERWNNSR